MGEKVKAYDGKEPYIFISYSHKDTRKVKPIISGLQQRGYRVWFDQGIHGGVEWEDFIAGKVKGCAAFILFVSRHYNASDNCKKEIGYAQKNKRPTLPIYLEEVELSAGLDMALSIYHGLMPSRTWNEDDFWDFINLSDMLQPCKDGYIQPQPAKKFPPANIIFIGIGLVVLLMALRIFRPSGQPELSAQDQDAPSQIVSTDTQPSIQGTTVPADTRPLAPQTLSGNVLMEVPKPEADSMENDPAFGTTVTRAEVGSVWFHDSLNGAPQDAVDASQAQDGSVLVWAEKSGELYQLHFAGEGGVDAPKNSAYLFRDMVNVNQIHFLDSFFTANAESMTSMFYRCEKLYFLDVTGFNTAKVKSFHMMFADCQMLSDLDLSSFDTSGAVYMSHMFFNCKRLWELDLSGFCTENVTDMRGMFYLCEKLLTVDLSSFDTGNVKNMSSMFCCCRDLTRLDVRHFDTSNVTDMSHIFHGCESLLELDVSGFDTSRVTDMSGMFSGCSKVSEVDVSGFDTSHVTDMSYMFCDCSNLDELNLSGFQTFNVTDMSYMFYNDGKLTELDFSGFHTEKVTAYENFMLENQKVHNLPWQGLFAGSQE